MKTRSNIQCVNTTLEETKTPEPECVPSPEEEVSVELDQSMWPSIDPEYIAISKKISPTLLLAGGSIAVWFFLMQISKGDNKVAPVVE